MLTVRKIERICLDSDCILRYDYLQAYAPHVYDKQIYFCSPNNFSVPFLILSTVRRLFSKLSLNDLKIAVQCPNPCFFMPLRIKLSSSGVKGTRSEFLNSFTVFDAVEFLSSPGSLALFLHVPFCSLSEGWFEHIE